MPSRSPCSAPRGEPRGPCPIHVYKYNLRNKTETTHDQSCVLAGGTDQSSRTPPPASPAPLAPSISTGVLPYSPVCPSICLPTHLGAPRGWGRQLPLGPLSWCRACERGGSVGETSPCSRRTPRCRAVPWFGDTTAGTPGTELPAGAGLGVPRTRGQGCRCGADGNSLQGAPLLPKLLVLRGDGTPRMGLSCPQCPMGTGDIPGYSPHAPALFPPCAEPGDPRGQLPGGEFRDAAASVPIPGHVCGVPTPSTARRGQGRGVSMLPALGEQLSRGTAPAARSQSPCPKRTPACTVTPSRAALPEPPSPLLVGGRRGGRHPRQQPARELPRVPGTSPNPWPALAWGNPTGFWGGVGLSLCPPPCSGVGCG